MSANDSDADEKPKSNKKPFIIIGAALAVVLAALAVVAMMFLGGDKKEDSKKSDAPEAGFVIPLEDEMTINLADGKFLKMQLALQLTKEASDEAGDVKVATTEYDGSKAQDAAITVFSHYTYDDLLKAPKKAEAQKKLVEEVKRRYDEKVMDVYFRQFVMQ